MAPTPAAKQQPLLRKSLGKTQYLQALARDAGKKQPKQFLNDDPSIAGNGTPGQRKPPQHLQRVESRSASEAESATEQLPSSEAGDATTTTSSGEGHPAGTPADDQPASSSAASTTSTATASSSPQGSSAAAALPFFHGLLDPNAAKKAPLALCSAVLAVVESERILAGTSGAVSAVACVVFCARGAGVERKKVWGEQSPFTNPLSAVPSPRSVPLPAANTAYNILWMHRKPLVPVLEAHGLRRPSRAELAPVGRGGGSSGVDRRLLERDAEMNWGMQMGRRVGGRTREVRRGTEWWLEEMEGGGDDVVVEGKGGGDLAVERGEVEESGVEEGLKGLGIEF